MKFQGQFRQDADIFTSKADSWKFVKFFHKDALIRSAFIKKELVVFLATEFVA